MANTIKIKRSAVPAKAPTTGDLALGELALNTYDGKLYTKKDNGTASIVELSAVPDGDKGDITVSASGTTWTIDSGVVTSDKIADSTIVDGDISATAEIAVSKLADGAARQLLQTDAAGTGVEWTSNVDIPGTLDVTSAATFDSTISFPLGTAALPSIYPGADTNTGFWSPAADTLAASTAGSERLRVTSTGGVVIGHDNTGSNIQGGVLNVHDAAGDHVTIHTWNSDNTRGGDIQFARSLSNTFGTGVSLTVDTNIGNILFRGWSGASYGIAATISCAADAAFNSAGDNSDNPGRLVFSTTADGSGAAAEAMRINSQQEVLIGTTTRNANGGVLQLKSGITFPATQVASADANTLDDYEEGAFTPAIIGTTTAGTGTYSAQLGRYTKVGDWVMFRLRIIWTAHTGTGSMRITGLPFTSNASELQTLSILPVNITSPASTYVTADLDNNDTIIRFYSTALATSAQTALAIDTAATITCQGCYQT